MVTLKDIARQLGVARSTVGRALAGDASIGPATSARVRATAERMGYVADARTRVMRGGTAPHVAEVTA